MALWRWRKFQEGIRIFGSRTGPPYINRNRFAFRTGPPLHPDRSALHNEASIPRTNCEPKELLWKTNRSAWDNYEQSQFFKTLQRFSYKYQLRESYFLRLFKTKFRVLYALVFTFLSSQTHIWFTQLCHILVNPFWNPRTQVCFFCSSLWRELCNRGLRVIAEGVSTKFHGCVSLRSAAVLPLLFGLRFMWVRCVWIHFCISL